MEIPLGQTEETLDGESFVREETEHKSTALVFRIIVVVVLLFSFLVGVKTLEGSFKLLGGGVAQTLFDLAGGPFVGLMAGMLATVLFQSSSVTTSIIVGLVSSQTLGLTMAIPMIMGANLGTSVTNTFVSMGYIKDKSNFKQAFAAATVHDFFNILSVLILLPLELATGFLHKVSTHVATLIYGTQQGFNYASPIKAALKPPVSFIKGNLLEICSLNSWGKSTAGVLMAIMAAIIIVGALAAIVKTMKHIVSTKSTKVINNFLTKGPLIGVLVGTGLTVAVQSSSITTSLLVPLAGSGLLTLESLFPITIGANIGTTATALIASMAGNIHGLTIALVHFFFNIIGGLMWFAHPKLRQIPIFLARGLASGINKSKLVGPIYVATVFFIIPVTMIALAN